jgi:hypothetical protein
MKKRFLIPLLLIGAPIAIGTVSAIAQSASCVFGSKTACTELTTQRKQSEPTPAIAVKPAASVEPAIDYNRISYQGQLMTDYKVGKVLGEIKCGKRPVHEGTSLLNVNGVPAALLANQTPEVVMGYASVARSWDCN